MRLLLPSRPPTSTRGHREATPISRPWICHHLRADLLLAAVGCRDRGDRANHSSCRAPPCRSSCRPGCACCCFNDRDRRERRRNMRGSAIHRRGQRRQSPQLYASDRSGWSQWQRHSAGQRCRAAAHPWHGAGHRHSSRRPGTSHVARIPHRRPSAALLRLTLRTAARWPPAHDSVGPAARGGGQERRRRQTCHSAAKAASGMWQAGTGQMRSNSRRDAAAGPVPGA